jgi:hypothetical protein
MGVNASNLALMALARTEGADFSRVVTIGRYRLEMSIDELEDFFRRRGRDDLSARASHDISDAYCEKLIKVAFGSAVVQSIDASAYEHADILHDMNTPVDACEPYSVVLDFGTLEHVFNLPVAFDNVARLCGLGGRIMHMLPANNLVGHGFYQFSPEFFFQIYAPERGFEGTRVFAVADGDPNSWYELKAPRDMHARVNITSRDQLHLLVLTTKVREQESLVCRPVQQSDYVALWNKSARKAPTSVRRGPLSRVVRALFNKIRHRRKMARRDVAAHARADVARRDVLSLAPNFDRG